MTDDTIKISLWKRCEELANENGARISVKESFRITRRDGTIIAGLSSVEEVHSFLCGYDWGKSERK